MSYICIYIIYITEYIIIERLFFLREEQNTSEETI